MRYTFSQLVAALAVAKAFPASLDPTEQKAMTNEALEHVINSGRWNGTQDTLTVHLNSSGELTLPRHWQTLLGVKVDGVVRDLAGPWYSYLPGTSDASQWSTNVIDRGDNHVTFAQPSAIVTVNGVSSVQNVPAQIRIASVGGAGTTIVHGYDANGAEVYNGTTQGAVLTFNAAKALPYFNIVRDLIMPVTTQQKFLYACYDDSTEEIIGIYEPGETVAQLRRYLVSEAQMGIPDDLSSIVVQARAQRRFVAMVADNDIVPIGNLSAMISAVHSVNWRREGEATRSHEELDHAIRLLNDELKRQRPPTETGAMRVYGKYTGGWGIRAMR